MVAFFCMFFAWLNYVPRPISNEGCKVIFNVISIRGQSPASFVRCNLLHRLTARKRAVLRLNFVQSY